MFTRFVVAALAATAIAAPAAAVVTFNFGAAGTAASVASVSRTNNSVTAVATARRFTATPSSLTNLSQTTAQGSIRQTTPGIGVAGGASNEQLDTNQVNTREGILVSLSKAINISGLKLSFIDNDDTLAIFGVNADNSLSYIGYNGEIRVLGGTALAGAATGSFASVNSGTSTLSLVSPTGRFDRFLFTTRVGGDTSYLGTLGQGYRIDSITGMVPEPGTWAMLVLGFGLVGVTARRRRPATVLA